MLEETEFPADYISLYEEGGACNVFERDGRQIEDAVQEFVHSGRDCLLDLTMTSGMRYRIKASQVRGWTHSTARGRRRVQELNRVSQDEYKANRIAAGLPWEEDK